MAPSKSLQDNGLRYLNHIYNRPRLRPPQHPKCRSLATVQDDKLPSHPFNLPSRAPPYQKILSSFARVRRVLPSARLTLAEKILYSHLENPEELHRSHNAGNESIRGNANLKLKPDRVAMQDASAQMALLQFMSCGLPSTAVPASIHCDHMIVGERGADVDVPASIQGNKEVYDFLESAAKKYGIEFWPPGAGIIHQAVLENYAAPGLMMLGTDSHTPNAGGLGSIAIGVGGADAVDALVDAPWELKAPKVLGVRLEGELSGWTSAKDVILSLAGQLTVRGATGAILEYHGPGAATLSSTGMATICNMGAELGATTSLFPFTPHQHTPYLHATSRAPIALTAESIAASPAIDNLVQPDQDCHYDQLVTIDLAALEPHINGPFTPDLSVPISQFGEQVRAKQYPESFGASLIGSCTNSSYEDMTRSESLVKQATAANLKPAAPLFVTPGSEQIRATLEDSSTLNTFADAGATVLANACGPCIGQWKRTDGVAKGDTNAIFTSYNRNFPGRNDGNRQTMNFLASPEIVTAMAFSGSTSFNPVTDSIETPEGSHFRFDPPHGTSLPSSGFAQGNAKYKPTPPSPDPAVTVAIDPHSDRLATLEPFPPFPKTGELTGLRVLLKIKGQCTTDTISAAGPWLKYKGHLPNISANTLISAVNAETGEPGMALDLPSSSSSPSLSEEQGSNQPIPIPELASRWRSRNQPWLVVAEHNYGEGSAREHAALQPRYLGAKAILAKSFARIHEANLVKQGVVPLTFADEADWDRIGGRDEVETVGLREVLRGADGGEAPEMISLRVRKYETGEAFTIQVRHGLGSADRRAFVRAGSALNLLGSRAQERQEARAS